MKLKEIDKFVKKCVKDNTATKVLLAILVEEYQKRKSKYFLMGATQVNIDSTIRYILYAIPDDVSKQIEEKITSIIRKKNRT